MADVAPAVLITGATSGLGRYLAKQLASSGWQVLAHGRDPARVADLCAELGGDDAAASSLTWPRSAKCETWRPGSPQKCRGLTCW
jgi:NADP-dependent 3-hydroxy acid dehydrogenase YdfG